MGDSLAEKVDRAGCWCMQVLLPGETGDVGFKQAMQQKWLATDKSGGVPMIVRKVGIGQQWNMRCLRSSPHCGACLMPGIPSYAGGIHYRQGPAAAEGCVGRQGH